MQEKQQLITALEALEGEARQQTRAWSLRTTRFHCLPRVSKLLSRSVFGPQYHRPNGTSRVLGALGMCSGTFAEPDCSHALVLRVSVYLSVCLSVCLSVYLSIYLSICPCFSIFSLLLKYFYVSVLCCSCIYTMM